MKGHKAHHHSKSRAKGGMVESGAKEWEQDLKTKPEEYTRGKPEKEAEERKHGGRARRKHGGHVVHHEHGKHLAHAKHVGPVQGGPSEHHAGRKPRKRGGACSDTSPMSSAHVGHPPARHKDEDID